MQIRKKNGQFKKGHNGLIGFRHSDRSKKRTSETLKSLYKEGKWKPGKGRKFEKGHMSYWSEETKKKVSEKFKKEIGEKNRNWKGGISGFTNHIRKSEKMEDWRKSIFERDNYACVICGIKNGLGKTIYLEADHYPKTFSEIIQENNIKSLKDGLNCETLWDINNGQTLCRSCHNKNKNGRPKKL